MLEENRRVEPCKVDKSNGIEIQINAAFNDAYRISRLWKGRKREGKDPIMSRGGEGKGEGNVGKNEKETMDDVRRIWSDSTPCYQSPWNLSIDANSILMWFCLRYIVAIGNDKKVWSIELLWEMSNVRIIFTLNNSRYEVWQKYVSNLNRCNSVEL